MTMNWFLDIFPKQRGKMYSQKDFAKYGFIFSESGFLFDAQSTIRHDGQSIRLQFDEIRWSGCEYGRSKLIFDLSRNKSLDDNNLEYALQMSQSMVPQPFVDVTSTALSPTPPLTPMDTVSEGLL